MFRAIHASPLKIKKLIGLQILNLFLLFFDLKAVFLSTDFHVYLPYLEIILTFDTNKKANKKEICYLLLLQFNHKVF